MAATFMLGYKGQIPLNPPFTKGGKVIMLLPPLMGEGPEWGVRQTPR